MESGSGWIQAKVSKCYKLLVLWVKEVLKQTLCIKHKHTSFYPLALVEHLLQWNPLQAVREWHALIKEKLLWWRALYLFICLSSCLHIKYSKGGAKRSLLYCDKMKRKLFDSRTAAKHNLIYRHVWPRASTGWGHLTDFFNVHLNMTQKRYFQSIRFIHF